MTEMAKSIAVTGRTVKDEVLRGFNATLRRPVSIVLMSDGNYYMKLAGMKHTTGEVTRPELSTESFSDLHSAKKHVRNYLLRLYLGKQAEVGDEVLIVTRKENITATVVGTTKYRDYNKNHENYDVIINNGGKMLSRQYPSNMMTVVRKRCHRFA